MVSQSLKLLIKRSFFYPFVLLIRQRQQIQEWKRQGKPLPPPHLVKQKTLKEYAQRFSLRVLIETGTYRGDMVEAVKRSFSAIYSIELDKGLYENVKERFASDKQVTILQGDSGERLAGILKKVNEPCLFWLDGHYSNGITAKGTLSTPIIQELETIWNYFDPRHVILIDDARCFTGKDDYPTIENLRDSILGKNPTMLFEVKDDIIRIYKKI